MQDEFFFIWENAFKGVKKALEKLYLISKSVVTNSAKSFAAKTKTPSKN